jgi:AcrR family transcriptional regulator
MADAPRRLPAGERRQVIIDAATLEFARKGWGAATTAGIAAAAGCNEALLFRHFGSKQGLYLAAIEAAAGVVRTACEQAFAGEPDASLHWRLVGRTFLQLARSHPNGAQLWVRALADSTGVPAIDEYVESRMREVHDFVTAVLERSQAAGGVLPQRRPAAEAWTIIALGWLGITGTRLGELVLADFDDVLASHREWLTGDPV